jgi:hypothetical protein
VLFKKYKNMANQSKLKAWVRYDGTGRVISGGPIFQVNKPKVGNWKQIDANLCCNGTTPTTTTTTTAGGGGVTPTAFVKNYWLNADNACNNSPDGTLVFYSASSVLQPGSFIFYDAALTNPVMGLVINVDPYVYPRLPAVSGGFLNPNIVCPTITTTSTTTQAVNNGIFRQSEDSNAVCSTSNLVQLFWVGELTNGTAVFTNQELTQGYNNLGYVANTSTNAKFSTSNGYAFNNGFC